jgi:hypothetical protein
LDGLNSALCSALKANLKEVADAEYQPARKNRIKDENGLSKSPAKAKRAAVAMSREISDLLAEIGAHTSDWKIRMKSLESMEKIFRMSGGDCELCADLQASLFKSIAVLLKDSNKNIIGASLLKYLPRRLFCIRTTFHIVCRAKYSLNQQLKKKSWQISNVR